MGLRVGGLASGLDTAALIDALMSLERRPLQLLQQRKAEAEARRDLFLELNTKLVALRDAAAAIDSLSSGLAGPSVDEEFLAFTAASSDEGILTATASSTAAPGTTDIVVDALAQTARHVSTAFSSDTDVIANNNRRIQIDHGGPDQIDIRVGPGGANLRDLADLINTDPNNGGEVRADVIFDGSGYRLIVAGTNPGVANDVSVSTNIGGESGPDFLDDALSVAATDAQLTVFGLSITRPDNSIADLIPGVSLELQSAAPGTTVSVQVSRDDEEIEAKIQGFVDAYNEVVGFMETNARYDATAEVAGALVGDSTIRGVEQQVQRAIVSAFGFVDNPFNSLAQIGIGLEDDGRLALESDDLRAALSTDAGAVRQLFSGDGVTDGAAAALARMIDPIVDSNANLGTLAIRNAGFGDRIEGMDRQIERLEARLEKREELLVLQFSQLETVLARLQNQGNALSSLSLLNQQDR